MNYNYSKLKGRIVEICGTQSKFASLMGISLPLLTSRLGNQRAFTQKEIERAINILKLTRKDILTYFFTENC